MGVFLSGCPAPDELMRVEINGAGQVAAGNSFPTRSRRSFSVFGVLADTAVYYEKPEHCRAAANITRVQLPGSVATFLYYYTFPFSKFLNLQTARM